MPLASLTQSRPIEYLLIHGATPTGPAIGTYDGKPIAASIVDAFGRSYVFAGVAPRRWNGQFDGDALGRGEFILQPGLVYRVQKSR